MVSRAFLIFLVTCTLLACSSGGVIDSEAPAPAPAAPPAVPPPAEDASAHDAVAGLIEQARVARLEQRFDNAGRLLGRAQRIDPRNARVYLEFAELALARGDGARARTMAERGLLYCARDTCAQLREFTR